MSKRKVARGADGPPIWLNVGGEESCEGWTCVNVQEEFADVVADARKLPYRPRTVDRVYASHILEHLPYNGPVGKALKEWFRVLKHDGKLYVSVPDLRAVADMYLRAADRKSEVYFMRVIYGGRTNEWDIHQAGFSENMLRSLLLDAGFRHIERVTNFGFFNDTSVLKIAGEPISLNLEATK